MNVVNWDDVSERLEKMIGSFKGSGESE